MTPSSPGKAKSGTAVSFANVVALGTCVKGVGMPWPKKIFFEFIVGLDRVAQDKLFGVGMTLLRPRVCPLETV